MRGLVLVVCVLLFLCPSDLAAQEPYLEKGFVILLSTKQYDKAARTARIASRLLDVKVDLRDYIEGDNSGLMLAEIDPSEEDLNLYEYIPRGRWDDGVYLSIEYTDYFENFTEGYYIVVLASDTKGSVVLQEALKKAKIHYPDAYIKNTTVFMGSMF